MRKARRQPSRTQKMQQFFHQLTAAPTTHSLNKLLGFIIITNLIMYVHQRIERSKHRTSSTTNTATATEIPTRSAPISRNDNDTFPGHQCNPSPTSFRAPAVNPRKAPAAKRPWSGKTIKRHRHYQHFFLWKKWTKAQKPVAVQMPENTKCCSLSGATQRSGASA